MNDERINSREIKPRLQEQISCDSKCICWKTDLPVFMCKGKLSHNNCSCKRVSAGSALLHEMYRFFHCLTNVASVGSEVSIT